MDKFGYQVAVCMSGCKANHGLLLWFPLSLHDEWLGLKLDDGSEVKL